MRLSSFFDITNPLTITNHYNIFQPFFSSSLHSYFFGGLSLQQEAYKIIGCRCVDCRSFEYNGTEYDVWFDDEFLLKNGPLYPTLFLGELKPNFFDVICGNFIIAKCNEEGETISISTDEAKALGTFMQKSIDKLNRAAHMGLIGGVKTA